MQSRASARALTNCKRGLKPAITYLTTQLRGNGRGLLPLVMSCPRCLASGLQRIRRSDISRQRKKSNRASVGAVYDRPFS
jgi:hypothetical protein